MDISLDTALFEKVYDTYKNYSNIFKYIFTYIYIFVKLKHNMDIFLV